MIISGTLSRECVLSAVVETNQKAVLFLTNVKRNIFSDLFLLKREMILKNFIFFSYCYILFIFTHLSQNLLCSEIQ